VKREIATNGAPRNTGPYSQGLAMNGFLFVSGQGAIDPATSEIVPGTIEEQTRLTMDNIRSILAAGGCSMDDIAKVTVYLADMADFERFNAVYRTYFTAPLPARSCVAAGLDGILVEIDAIAAIPVKEG